MRRWRKREEDEDRVPREVAQSPTWGQPSVIFSLEIYDFGEDPEEVTRILGITPTSSGKRGEYAVHDSGRRYRNPRREPEWKFSLQLLMTRQ